MVAGFSRLSRGVLAAALVVPAAARAQELVAGGAERVAVEGRVVAVDLKARRLLVRLGPDPGVAADAAADPSGPGVAVAGSGAAELQAGAQVEVRWATGARLERRSAPAALSDAVDALPERPVEAARPLEVRKGAWVIVEARRGPDGRLVAERIVVDRLAAEAAADAPAAASDAR